MLKLKFEECILWKASQSTSRCNDTRSAVMKVVPMKTEHFDLGKAIWVVALTYLNTRLFIQVYLIPYKKCWPFLTQLGFVVDFVEEWI